MRRRLKGKSMPDVYIAGELTRCENPEVQKRFYEAMAGVCRERGFSVYLPHQHTDPVNHPHVSPQEVYRKDWEIVAGARILIAYVGQPSLGVGTELEIAKNSGTEIILLHHKGEKVSRMARGNPAVKAVIAYESESEALDRLRDVLKA